MKISYSFHSKVKELIKDKYISAQKHPTEDLYILNYTQKCQFEPFWTPETMACRGLIIRSDREIVARPFDKFFNVGEQPVSMPTTVKFSAWDKLDGSLGILYQMLDGRYAIATRGSFTSEQAIKATEMFNDVINSQTSLAPFKSGMTYLFEIIYPQNRIVVDYKGESKLVFLGARSINTGKIYTPDWFPDIAVHFERAYPISDYKTPRNNAEGVVLYYENDYMVKVKYEEYVRLHRLVTGVTARRIWDILRQNKVSQLGEQKVVLKDMLERVPEEFADWVNQTARDLISEFVVCEGACMNITNQAREMDGRREQAIFIQKMTESIKDGTHGVCFAMLDNKSYSDIIWKMLKPKHELPFRKDE